MSKADETQPVSDRAILALATVLLILFVWKRSALWATGFRHWTHAHPGPFALLIAGAAVLASVFLFALIAVVRDAGGKRRYLASVTGARKDSVLAGRADSGEWIHIPIEARRMHAQVIGTTNAGKTESVIIPWAVADIQARRGFVMVDGKADRSFLDKIYAYARHFSREGDFLVFSLQDPSRSHTFNPLIGASPEEVAERVFNSFEFENSYFASVQFEIFSNVLRILHRAKVVPTFLRVHQAIRNPETLYLLAVQGGDEGLESWAAGFKALVRGDREERTSGLLAAISHFAFGSHAKLFNTDEPDIDLVRAIRENQLIYFQLPVLKAPFLGKATGKLVLQCLQSAVSERHRAGDGNQPFFSILLDDFTEYLYKGFVSLLNKSRSANVGVVFAHQALGDIRALGDDVATSILTNSNLKVVMRGNDPESAEYFAKVIGTTKGEQITERADSGIWGRAKTGQGSLRQVEEFVVHPNVIKRGLGVGEAITIIPHRYGTRTIKLHFRMLPDIPLVEMPPFRERKVLGLKIVQTAGSATQAEQESSFNQVLETEANKENK